MHSFDDYPTLYSWSNFTRPSLIVQLKMHCKKPSIILNPHARLKATDPATIPCKSGEPSSNRRISKNRSFRIRHLIVAVLIRYVYFDLSFFCLVFCCALQTLLDCSSLGWSSLRSQELLGEGLDWTPFYLSNRPYDAGQPFLCIFIK